MKSAKKAIKYGKLYTIYKEEGLFSSDILYLPTMKVILYSQKVNKKNQEYQYSLYLIELGIEITGTSENEVLNQINHTLELYIDVYGGKDDHKIILEEMYIKENSLKKKLRKEYRELQYAYYLEKLQSFDNIINESNNELNTLIEAEKRGEVFVIILKDTINT
jgi:hypothetical protein